MVLFLLLDSAQNSMIEATQAYGIEEASETESEAQVNQLSKHFLLYITQQIPIIRNNKATKYQGLCSQIPILFCTGRYGITSVVSHDPVSNCLFCL